MLMQADPVANNVKIRCKLEPDTVDSALLCESIKKMKKVPSIEMLNSEMPRKELQKDRGKRALKCLLNKFRCKKYACATISKPDPTYRVAYLGNVVTGWAKGEGCFEKPLATLWRNYTQSSRPDVRMQLTVCGGGLKATTKDHGLTEYWAHRLTTCAAPAQFPRLFCWIYRHEGKRLRHELRCHAVLCTSSAVAKQIESELKQSLALALLEFKRDKLSRQNARLSLVNSVYENPTLPRRKILLSTGPHNYKPPLERSKSAPKLTSIEEIIEEEDDIFQSSHKIYNEILKHYASANTVLDKRKSKLNILREMNHQGNGSFAQIKSEKLEENLPDLTLDEKSDIILEELVQNTLSNDLVESCEQAWFNALRQKPDLIPNECDETSLSSGCESTSTITSEFDHSNFPTINETYEAGENETEAERKTDLDFKIGSTCNVLSTTRSFEKIVSGDILHYCGLNSMYNKTPILDQDEVSLVPVGENNIDFSSLKVYKKRSMSVPYGKLLDEEETISACSDESGFEEEELVSSVANIVLV